MMEQCKDVHEFVARGYNHDLIKILNKHFKNVLNKHSDPDIDEVIVNDFLCKCIEKDTIQRFDPKRNVKFSTYMCSCLRFFVLAYFNMTTKADKVRMDSLSLDYEMEDGNTLHGVIEDTSDNSLELSVEKKHAYKYLEDRHDGLGKAAIPLHTLYYLIVMGHTDKEIATRYGMTIAGIGARKRKLIGQLRKFYLVNDTNLGSNSILKS